MVFGINGSFNLYQLENNDSFLADTMCAIEIGLI